MQAPIGLYVHVPFCAVKCPYCDFYSLPYRRQSVEDYLNALNTEISSYQGKGWRADTLYFGGGTPSLLSPSQIGSVIDLARRVFALSGEITMEANPNTLTLARLKEYRQAGINRISLGMQSASERELSALGRRHSAAQSAAAVHMAAEAGISNISVDFMLGVPFQTEESVLQTLSFLKELPITHLSAYLLKVEEGTPYQNSPLLAQCAGEDALAELYLTAQSALARMGLLQYEISNFARPGWESAHNLKYWRCEEYLGFGPAAHSFLQGKRFCHPADLSLYQSDPVHSIHLTDSQAGGLDEKLMLGLRLTEGIPVSWLQPLPPERQNAFFRQVRLYQGHGLLRWEEGRIAFTPRGFLVSNSILADLESRLFPEC